MTRLKLIVFDMMQSKLRLFKAFCTNRQSRVNYLVNKTDCHLDELLNAEEYRIFGIDLDEIVRQREKKRTAEEEIVISIAKQGKNWKKVAKGFGIDFLTKPETTTEQILTTTEIESAKAAAVKSLALRRIVLEPLSSDDISIIKLFEVDPIEVEIEAAHLVQTGETETFVLNMLLEKQQAGGVNNENVGKILLYNNISEATFLKFQNDSPKKMTIKTSHAQQKNEETDHAVLMTANDLDYLIKQVLNDGIRRGYTHPLLDVALERLNQSAYRDDIIKIIAIELANERKLSPAAHQYMEEHSIQLDDVFKIARSLKALKLVDTFDQSPSQFYRELERWNEFSISKGSNNSEKAIIDAEHIKNFYLKRLRRMILEDLRRNRHNLPKGWEEKFAIAFSIVKLNSAEAEQVVYEKTVSLPSSAVQTNDSTTSLGELKDTIPNFIETLQLQWKTVKSSYGSIDLTLEQNSEGQIVCSKVHDSEFLEVYDDLLIEQFLIRLLNSMIQKSINFLSNQELNLMSRKLNLLL